MVAYRPPGCTTIRDLGSQHLSVTLPCTVPPHASHCACTALRCDLYCPCPELSTPCMSCTMLSHLWQFPPPPTRWCWPAQGHAAYNMSLLVFWKPYTFNLQNWQINKKYAIPTSIYLTRQCQCHSQPTCGSFLPPRLCWRALPSQSCLNTSTTDTAPTAWCAGQVQQQ
jgi:hypothetical protein